MVSGDNVPQQEAASVAADESALNSAENTDQTSGAAYADRVIARAKELRLSSAFELRERQINSLVSARQAKATTAMHKRNTRRAIISFAIALLAVIGISLCLPYRGFGIIGGAGGYYGPLEVIDAYKLWFYLNVGALIDPTITSSSHALLNEFADIYGSDAYTLIVNRGAATLLVIICGMMLALSGSLFQSTFRNPLAAPTMLGVSDGVTLGILIFCMLGHETIGDDPNLYALLVYGCGALVVILVLLTSRLLSGGRRYNVLDMLLLGTVVCQLIGGINNFVQVFVMGETEWDSFYAIQQSADALMVPTLSLMAVVVFVVTFALVYFWRFKLNLVSFDDDDAIMMGTRVGFLRVAALILGSVMELAAMATVGQVAMLSLAVPFLVRYLMTADFRTQLLGNCLVGSLLLLVCMVIQHFFTVGFITIPLGTIVSVAIVPFFVWVVAFAQNRWL